MTRARACRAFALLVLAGPATFLRCEAMLYRCPARTGEGMVVTNLVDEATARDRACQAIKARRSPMDAPLQDGAATNAKTDAARRIGDEWLDAGAKRAAPPPPRAVVTSPAAEAERRRILEAELHAEELALAQARANATPPSSAARSPRSEDDAEFALAMRMQGGAKDLARERQAFDEGKALARHSASFDDAVQRHAENIEALKREIDRMH